MKAALIGPGGPAVGFLSPTSIVTVRHDGRPAFVEDRLKAVKTGAVETLIRFAFLRPKRASERRS